MCRSGADPPTVGGRADCPFSPYSKQQQLAGHKCCCHGSGQSSLADLAIPEPDAGVMRPVEIDPAPSPVDWTEAEAPCGIDSTRPENNQLNFHIWPARPLFFFGGHQNFKLNTHAVVLRANSKVYVTGDITVEFLGIVQVLLAGGRVFSLVTRITPTTGDSAFCRRKAHQFGTI